MQNGALEKQHMRPNVVETLWNLCDSYCFPYRQTKADSFWTYYVISGL